MISPKMMRISSKVDSYTSGRKQMFHFSYIFLVGLASISVIYIGGTSPQIDMHKTYLNCFLLQFGISPYQFTNKICFICISIESSVLLDIIHNWQALGCLCKYFWETWPCPQMLMSKRVLRTTFHAIPWIDNYISRSSNEKVRYMCVSFWSGSNS